MCKSFHILLQYGCPQQALSRFAGWVSRIQLPWFKNWVIKRFIRKYQVDLSLALIEQPEAYLHFNDFFTRQLKPSVRPITSGQSDLASPVDGTISQIGRIEQDTLLQAKGFHFSLAALLGGAPTLAKEFQQGYFATIYLAPKDYHRIHMPFPGKLRQTIYIPGKLFSVNQLTTQSVPNLFSRNERLVCIFDTAAGPMAVILVGAMLVSGISTAWDQNHPDNIQLQRGDQLGHFNMGSTVILLFANNRIAWDALMQENSTVKMGQKMGECQS